MNRDDPGRVETMVHGSFLLGGMVALPGKTLSALCRFRRPRGGLPAVGDGGLDLLRSVDRPLVGLLDNLAPLSELGEIRQGIAALDTRTAVTRVIPTRRAPRRRRERLEHRPEQRTLQEGARRPHRHPATQKRGQSRPSQVIGERHRRQDRRQGQAPARPRQEVAGKSRRTHRVAPARPKRSTACSTRCCRCFASAGASFPALRQQDAPRNPLRLASTP